MTVIDAEGNATDSPAYVWLDVRSDGSVWLELNRDGRSLGLELDEDAALRLQRALRGTSAD